MKEKTILKSKQIIKAAEDLWCQINLFESPYFYNLKNKTTPKHLFVESQCAFLHAVTYFSRPMSALASRIDSTQARLHLIENIYEEHGEMKEEFFHENTFIKWLHQLNPETAEIEFPLKPCVDAFNAALMGTCQTAPIEKGICCLGMIEFMFAYISKFIANATVNLKWIRLENLIHYNLHADLDIKHSRELFEIIDKIPQPNSDLCMEGLQLGAFIFYRLYDDLEKH